MPSEENRGETRWEAMQRYKTSERFEPDCKMAKSIRLTTPYVRRLGGDTEYPLAGLPISLVHGDYSLPTSGDVDEKQLYYSQSRVGI